MNSREALPFISWRAEHKTPRPRNVVFGPAYRPVAHRPRPRIRSGARLVRLDILESQALADYKERQLDAWLAGLGLTPFLATLNAHQVEAFRGYFGRCAGQTHPAYLHALQVGRDTDTGEELLVACAWPAQPRLHWRARPQPD